LNLFAVALWKVWLKQISLNKFKTIFSRVPSRLKQTIASIQLLIGIGKPGRLTVDNQSQSVLQPFSYVLIKTMVLMTLAKSTSAPWLYKPDTCIDRYSRSVVMMIMTIDNCCSQQSAPFNNFAHFAFIFKYINFFFRLTVFLKTLKVNWSFGRLTGLPFASLM